MSLVNIYISEPAHMKNIYVSQKLYSIHVSSVYVLIEIVN